MTSKYRDLSIANYTVEKKCNKYLYRNFAREQFIPKKKKERKRNAKVLAILADNFTAQDPD